MQIQIEVPDQTLAKLLGMARERGISYWCSGVKALRGRNTVYDSRTIKVLEQDLYYPIHDGKWIITDSVENKSHVLNHGALMAGLLTLVQKKTPAISLLLDGAAYSELGDMLVQYALFGELKYARGKEPGKGAVYVCKKCQEPQPCSCLRMS